MSLLFLQGADLNAMKALIDAGLLGKKTGKGIYKYAKDAKGKDVKGEKAINEEAMAILAKFRKRSRPLLL